MKEPKSVDQIVKDLTTKLEKKQHLEAVIQQEVKKKTPSPLKEESSYEKKQKEKKLRDSFQIKEKIITAALIFVLGEAYIFYLFVDERGIAIIPFIGATGLLVFLCYAVVDHG